LSAFDATPAASPLPAAVLVFRDGHREEVAKYTIVGGIIYLKADYGLPAPGPAKFVSPISTSPPP
jgi:hypothetical protein